jgi:DNA-binding transcriptional ArsR family regulator
LSQDSTLDRILSALNHPVRRRILRELVDGPGSASTLSRSFGMELSVVSYHLNKVLAKRCEVIELVKFVPRRGSVEKFYRLKGEFSKDLSASAESGSSDELFWTLSLGESLFKAAKSSEGGA